MGIGDDLQTGLTAAKELISENPIASAVVAGAGVVALGGAAGVIIASAVKKRKKKTKKSKKKAKKSKTKRRKSKLKFGSKAYRKKYLGKKHRRSKQRQPHTAGKRKDTSHRRIRYTKNNQPYVILSNGRARFIKRSSAKRSKKLKGGRY